VEAEDGSLRLPVRLAEIPDVEHHLLNLDFGGVVLAGTVVDAETERTVPNATVFATPKVLLRDGGPPTALADADGRFQLEVHAGEYRVAARAPGYSGATVDVDATTGGASELRLPLVRGGTVRGRVVDARGRSAGDGLVRALSPVPGAGAAALILPDGRFELTGLGSGEHTLVARSAPVSSRCCRASSGAEDVTLTLRRGGRIQLTLRNADGAPVVGASASVYRVDGVPIPGITGSGTSDGGGIAEILSPGGPVDVRAVEVNGAAIVAAGEAAVVVEEGGTVTAEVRLARPFVAARQD
jgi:hypothetical protein